MFAATYRSPPPGAALRTPAARGRAAGANAPTSRRGRCRCASAAPASRIADGRAPAACASSSSPAISRHDSSSRSVSRPGSTTAPCGKCAMVAISSAVAGIEPVEPAAITGPSVLRASRAASALISRSRRVGRLDAIALAQDLRPRFARDLQKSQRELPILIELVGHQLVEPIPRHAARRHVVDQPREIVGERASGRRCLGDQRRAARAVQFRRLRPLADELREQQPPLEAAERFAARRARPRRCRRWPLRRTRSRLRRCRRSATMRGRIAASPLSASKKGIAHQPAGAARRQIERRRRQRERIAGDGRAELAARSMPRSASAETAPTPEW